MKGRYPIFKCRLCGRYVSYDDIDIGRACAIYGTHEDDYNEVVSFEHKDCKTANRIGDPHGRPKSRL